MDALTEEPESVVVCEKHEGRTRLRRLNRKDLAQWLARYSLGELWMKGELVLRQPLQTGRSPRSSG